MQLQRQEAFPSDPPKALHDAFMALDSKFLDKCLMNCYDSGATAVVALISPDGTLYVAHVGDSRAALITKSKAENLTQDHKPHLPKEKKRIEEAGYIVRDRRVDGRLAVSRAIGDSDFKQSFGVLPEQFAVCACPDIYQAALPEDAEYLVLACDGLWDVMEPQHVAEYLRVQRGKVPDLAALADCLVNEAVRVYLLLSL